MTKRMRLLVAELKANTARLATSEGTDETRTLLARNGVLVKLLTLHGQAQASGDAVGFWHEIVGAGAWVPMP